jgi:hypothetical protein
MDEFFLTGERSRSLRPLVQGTRVRRETRAPRQVGHHRFLLPQRKTAKVLALASWVRFSFGNRRFHANDHGRIGKDRIGESAVAHRGATSNKDIKTGTPAFAARHPGPGRAGFNLAVLYCVQPLPPVSPPSFTSARPSSLALSLSTGMLGLACSLQVRSRRGDASRSWWARPSLPP